MSANLRAGPFRALKMRPVRQEAVHSLWSRLFCGPLKMRRVPEGGFFCTEFPFGTREACFLHRVPLKPHRVHQEPFSCTARPFGTPEGCFLHRVLSQRHFSRPHIFFGGGGKKQYICLSYNSNPITLICVTTTLHLPVKRLRSILTAPCSNRAFFQAASKTEAKSGN